MTKRTAPIAVHLKATSRQETANTAQAITGRCFLNSYTVCRQPNKYRDKRSWKFRRFLLSIPPPKRKAGRNITGGKFTSFFGWRLRQSPELQSVNNQIRHSKTSQNIIFRSQTGLLNLSRHKTSGQKIWELLGFSTASFTSYFGDNPGLTFVDSGSNIILAWKRLASRHFRQENETASKVKPSAVVLPRWRVGYDRNLNLMLPSGSRQKLQAANSGGKEVSTRPGLGFSGLHQVP